RASRSRGWATPRTTSRRSRCSSAATPAGMSPARRSWSTAAGSCSHEEAAMCRSIVTLRGDEAATDDEVTAAPLQFVRKVSGTRSPAQANQEIFERAVHEIAHATRHLLDDWTTP